MSTSALAQHVVNTQYSDLSCNTVEAARRSILDTLGVILAATTLEKPCHNLHEMFMEEGGKKESTILGFGGKAPCWTAAFVNGACAHAIDYDDSVFNNGPVHHPTASTFPAALAIAEKMGNISGQDFLAAIALGNDLSIRIASCPTGNTMTDYPFFPISIFGVFGATAASGKILNLNQIEMQNALGLAVHRAAGVREALFAPDSDVRGIRDGFTNKEGLISALMARKGISACKNGIELFLKAFYTDGYNIEPLTQKLGRDFRGNEAQYKIWPSCGLTHNYIQAALYLANKYDLKPELIDEVIVTGSKDGEQHCTVPNAFSPDTSIAAKFSVPFCIALAMVKRNVAIKHFLPQNLKEPEVISAAKKIKFRLDPAFGPFSPVKIEVSLKEGKHYSFKLNATPENSLKVGEPEIVAKFKDCAGYSSKHLSSAKIERLINSILNLEKVKDIREVTAILS